MKYNYYDSNKIVIHGKAVPGQTLAWGETKMLTADKIQSVNTTDYWGNVLYENSRPTTVLSNGRYILLNQDSTLTWCCVEKDHLGSNRVVRETTPGINRLQINHYYPFGNTFGEYNHCDEPPVPSHLLKSGKVITYNYATYPLRWASLPITLGNFAHPYGQSCPTQWADSDKAFR